MLLSSVVLRPSPTQGKGLFATRPLPAGTVVWHPCRQCRVWGPAEVESLPEDEYRTVDELGYWLTKSRLLLPCLNACWMNHSCRPATLDFGLDFGVTVRDIAPGEEITLDYRTFMSDPAWTVVCNCQQENCQRLITPSEGLDATLRADWKARLMKVLPLVTAVPQELNDSLSACSSSYRRLLAGSNPQEVLEEAVSIREPAFLEANG
jgi:hypothetical protein